MVVELRTLRVTADMDSSAYVRGMQEKVAADKAASASSRELASAAGTATNALGETGAASDQAKVKISSSVSVLERLSRQYVDGYGTAQKFNAEILRLARATDTQAVSVEHLEQVYTGIQRRYGMVADGTALAARGYADLAQAIANVNSKLSTQEVAMTKAAAANRQMIAANQNSAHGQNFNAANAAYQFQDVAVTAAMGMNPLMIGLQQGTQLAPVIAQMERPVAGLVSAFASLVSPVSLVTVGLTAGVAALIQYFTTADSGSEKVKKLFDDQNEAIRKAASAWGEATPAFKAYVDQLDRAEGITKGQKASDILAGRELQGLSERLDDIQRAGIAAFRSLQGDPNNAVMVRDLRDAWGDLRDRIKDGSVSFLDVTKVQRELGESVANYGTPQVLAFRDAFNEWTAAANRSVEAAMKVRQAWIETAAGGSSVQDIVAGKTVTENGVVYPTSRFEPRNVPTPSRRPTIELDDTTDEQIRRQIENARRIQEAELANLGARSPSELERAARAREEANIIKDEAEAARQSRINLAGTRARVEAEHQLAEAQRDRVRSLNESVASQQMELSLIGKTRGEVVALQTAYQLTAQLREEAARNNTKVDEREIELIQKKAAELGRLADLYARAQLRNDLQFERDQLLRSGVDQQIASRQRGAGLPVDLSSQEANMMRENIRIAELRDGIRGFFTDFRDGLMQGKNFGEALGGAILNALNNAMTKLSNSLIDSLVNSVMGSLGGSSGTGGTGGVNLGSVLSAATASRAAANSNVAGGYSGLSSASVVPKTDIASYITQAATARNIDPQIALAVARSEGGLNSWNTQSTYFKNGVQEPSFGPYQLYMGGGLGNAFQNQTGLDPRLAANGPAGVDFALDYASKNGWGSWYGAKNAGISNWQGIGQGSSQAATTAVNDLANSASNATGSIGSLGSGMDTAAKGLDTLGGGLGKFGNELGSAASSSGSSGGGLFGWLGNLFGGSSSSSSGSGGGPGAGFSLFGLKFADGTEGAPGGLAMVGERGRELINLPRGSQVVPNFRTEEMMRGRGAGNDVHVTVETVSRVDQDGNLHTFVERTATRVSKRESRNVVRDFSANDLPRRIPEIDRNPRKVG